MNSFIPCVGFPLKNLLLHYTHFSSAKPIRKYRWYFTRVKIVLQHCSILRAAQANHFLTSNLFTEYKETELKVSQRKLWAVSACLLKVSLMKTACQNLTHLCGWNNYMSCLGRNRSIDEVVKQLTSSREYRKCFGAVVFCRWEQLHRMFINLFVYFIFFIVHFKWRWSPNCTKQITHIKSECLITFLLLF